MRMDELMKKSINFGKIDHFLYVRICCLCADLGFTFQKFIEEGRRLIRNFIDEEGITHFQKLKEEWGKYESFRKQTRFAPRMKNERHSMNVNDIDEEVFDHLQIIKQENDLNWIMLLRSLVLVVEYHLDKVDEAALVRGEYREEADTIRSGLIGKSVVAGEDVQGIDKTRKTREWEYRDTGTPDEE